MTVLLDTNVLIDVLRNRNGRREFLADLLDSGNQLACCAVTVAEVYAGMRSAEARETAEFLNSLEYLEITRETSGGAGRMKAAWAKKGITLTLPDVLIAAVAIQHRAALATDNRKHFPMTELQILTMPEGSR
jgi:predicted nucleic acid-binding protein